MKSIAEMILESSAEDSPAAKAVISAVNGLAKEDFEFQDRFSPDGKVGILYTSLDRKGIMLVFDGGKLSRADYWPRIMIDEKGYPVKPQSSVIADGTDSGEVARRIAGLVSGKISEDDSGLPPVVNGKPAVYRKTAAEASNEAIAKENERKQVSPAFLQDLLRDKLEGMLHDDFDGLLIHGDPGVGKAQPDSTMMPTPSGVKRLDKLKVGDYVFDRHGKPTKILEIHPQGMKDVYEISFGDGRKARCCIDHLWPILSSRGNVNVKPLSAFIDSYRYTNKFGNSQFKVRIPSNGPARFEKRETKIDPWVLGCFLGNGCLRETSLTISCIDDEIPARIAKTCGFVLKKQKGSNCSYVFYDRKTGKPIGTKAFFKDYPELAGKYSIEKYIPEDYIFNDERTRLSLIQGLMDTDGCIQHSGGRYNCHYSTSSEKMMENAIFVLRSLGFKATVLEDCRLENVNYRIYVGLPNSEKIKLFSVKKKEALARMAAGENKRKCYSHVNVVGVRKLGKESQRCLLVDNTEHLYLTENFVVTHNTFPVKKFLEKHNIDVESYSGSITKVGLLMAFWENRKKSQWMLFDDIDSIFKDADCRNMLKAALDTDRDNRVVTYKTNNSFKAKGMTDEQIEKAVRDSGGVRYPDKFLYQGKIIFISNLSTSQIEPAILSRTQKVNYELTPAQIWDLTEHLMNSFDISRNPNARTRKYVLEIMKANWKLKEKPSFRVFMSSAATFARIWHSTGSAEKATEVVLYEIGGL